MPTGLGPEEFLTRITGAAIPMRRVVTFFEQLARRAVEGVFAPFQSAAGKGPLSGAVTAFSPTDEKLAVFGEQDDADADPRVHIASSSSPLLLLRAWSRVSRAWRLCRSRVRKNHS